MHKVKLRIGVLVLILMTCILASCGGKQSNASLLYVEDHMYIGKDVVPVDQYPNKTFIGEVGLKVNADATPEHNLSANELGVGTEIFKVEENLLAADYGNGQMKLFSLKR